MRTLDRETARGLLPRRAENGQKWAFGRTLLVCGSGAMPGAAVLSGLGALRSGVGLVQLATVEEAAAAARIWLPEALLLALPKGEGFPGSIGRENAWRLLEEGSGRRACCSAAAWAGRRTGASCWSSCAGAFPVRWCWTPTG